MHSMPSAGSVFNFQAFRSTNLYQVQGTKEYVKHSLKGALSKIQTVGNSTGQRTQCLQLIAWCAAVHVVAKSQTRLSDRTTTKNNYKSQGKTRRGKGKAQFVKETAMFMCSTVRHQGMQSFRLLHPGDFPGKHPGVGCHFLLQGIFLTQRSNLRFLHLLHCQADSLPLHHFGSPANCNTWTFFGF